MTENGNFTHMGDAAKLSTLGTLAGQQRRKKLQRRRKQLPTGKTRQPRLGLANDWAAVRGVGVGLGNGHGRSVAEVCGTVRRMDYSARSLSLAAAGTDDARTCHFPIGLFLRDAFPAQAENATIRLAVAAATRETLKSSYQIQNFHSPVDIFR